MIDAILKVLDLFRWLFRLLRVDYAKLRIILRVKLTNDTRRPYLNVEPEVKRTGKNKHKKSKSINTFAKLLFFHLAAGMALGIVAARVQSVFFAMFLVHAFVFMLAVLSLMNNFTTVLLDTSDNFILLPRPVDARTVFVSRIVHIFFYLFSVTLALAGTAWVVGAVKYGVLFAFGFLVTVLLSTLLSIFFIYFFYMLVLRFSSGEKLHRIITFFQVVMPLAMIIFYIIFSGVNLRSLNLSPTTWTYLLPPAWFGGFLQALVPGTFQAPYYLYTILAFGFPLLCMVVVVLLLAPGFNRRLSQMTIAPYKKKPAQPGSDISTFFSRLLGRNQTERAAFELIWKLAGRDKKYSIQVYPLLGTLIMFWYVTIIFGNKAILKALEALPHGYRHITLVYGTILIVLTAITQLPFSDYYRAARLYRILPVTQPGYLLSGGLKAVLLKFSFPYFFVVPFVLAVWGPGAIDDILLGLLNMLVTCLNLAFIYARCLPFSQKPDMVSMSGKILKTLAALIFYIGLGYLHYRLALLHPLAVSAAVVPMAGLFVFLSRRYRQTSWAIIDAQ